MKDKPIYETLGIDRESLIDDSTVYISPAGVGRIYIRDENGDEEAVFFRDTQDSYFNYPEPQSTV